MRRVRVATARRAVPLVGRTIVVVVVLIGIVKLLIASLREDIVAAAGADANVCITLAAHEAGEG